MGVVAVISQLGAAPVPTSQNNKLKAKGSVKLVAIVAGIVLGMISIELSNHAEFPPHPIERTLMVLVPEKAGFHIITPELGSIDPAVAGLTFHSCVIKPTATEF